jgi:L-alanine-DL-glutamate epimerase-like enolase superfamily enzyme
MRRRQGSANCSIGAIEVSKWISSFAPAMQLAESAVHHSPNMIRGCFGVDSCHWYWYVLKAFFDAERVRAVRASRQDVWLGVDANQGFTREFMQWIMPVLTEARVQLIEQPFPIGQESLLDGFESPVPIAADESVQSLADIPGLAGRFSVANIKL